MLLYTRPASAFATPGRRDRYDRRFSGSVAFVFGFLLAKYFVAVKVKAEKQTVVFGIIANNLCAVDHAAFDYLGDAEKLAETAFEVEPVALVGNKPNITFALVERFDEFSEIDLVKFYGTHLYHSFPLASPILYSRDGQKSIIQLYELYKIINEFLCINNKKGLPMARRKDFLFEENAAPPRFISALFASCGVRHAFFTRLGGVSKGEFAALNFACGSGEKRDTPDNVAANYAVAAGSFGLSAGDVCRVVQRHTDTVLRVSSSDRGAGVTRADFDSPADGLFTTESGILLTVRTADCVPVLIADKRGRFCAAVHSGWRGTAAGITARAVSLAAKAGIPPLDIIAAIGPCIGGECYEVGGELRESFPPYLSDCFTPRGGKFLLDLTEANIKVLENCGIPSHNISCADECTYCRGELFFSHRRSGPVRGTMGSFICI